MKKTLISIYGLTLFTVFIFVLLLSNKPAMFTDSDQMPGYTYEFIHGGIKETMPASNEDDAQILQVEAHSGKESGTNIIVPVSAMNNFNLYEIGEEIQIYKMTNLTSEEIDYEVSDYYHQTGLKWTFIIFAIISIIIAGKKGITALLSVVISMLLFYYLFLKMLIIGYSPILACLIFVSIVSILTIPLIHGFNKKSLSAILAIFIGYVLSIIISLIFKDIVQLGNTPNEEFRTLGIMHENIALAEILIASLFLGATGALIDTAISISSAIFEALKGNVGRTFKSVYKIGMEVGKDILGSMINTLLFAYLASSLPFFIMISLNRNSSLTELINMDFIALELTRTLVGAISLVILIPITASISAYFFAKITK